MALICMAVYDTVENQRTKYTTRAVNSIFRTIDLYRHHLVIVDNNSCKETKEFLEENKSDGIFRYTLITNEKNIGTAEAVNLGWRLRKPGEHCVKIDNDIVVYTEDWADELEAAANREPRIGQVAAKRKDLAESPNATDPHFISKLTMLPHKAGEDWIAVEEVNHCMGSCVLHSSALLDKVGYLYQTGLYGFDDSAMSFRSKQSGFINCFLPHIKIDHIDTGENPYTQEKIELANKAWPTYQQLIQDYKSGRKPLYYSPFEK